jgi:hypothetical protein
MPPHPLVSYGNIYKEIIKNQFLIFIYKFYYSIVYRLIILYDFFQNLGDFLIFYSIQYIDYKVYT